MAKRLLFHTRLVFKSFLAASIFLIPILAAVSFILSKTFQSPFTFFLHLFFILMAAAYLFFARLDRLSSAAQSAVVQKAFNEGKAELQKVIDAMPDLVCYRDADGRWIKANSFTADLFGMDPVEFEGKTNMELANLYPKHKHNFTSFEMSDLTVWQSGTIARFQETITHIDRRKLIFDIIKVPLFHDDGSRKGIVVLGRDMTLFSKAKDELHELHRQNELILASAGDGILGLDEAGRCIFINPAAQKILKYSEWEIIGQDIHSLIHHTREDGSQFPHQECPIYASINEGRSLQVYEDYFFTSEGHGFPVEYSTNPIRTKKSIVGTVVTFKDITERKKTEEFLRRTDKVSLASELAAGVGHEIRNPLTTLKGFLQLLRDREENRAYCDIMLEEIDRLDFITSEFMSLAKPQALIFRNKQVEPMIRNVALLLQSQATMRGIELKTEIAPSLPDIYCVEHQIKQVFINLIKNSIEAQVNGEILIEASLSGDDVRVRITDSGCGFSEEQLKRIGEPFYSTKEKGTGLGMMVCFNIISNHKGTIEVNSIQGKGTTMDIFLPVPSAVPVLQ